MLTQLTPAVVLALLVLTAGTSDRSGWLGAAALGALSIGWFLVNGPVEGVVLLSLTADRGLTGADLAGVVSLGLALWRLQTSIRPRRTAGRGSS